MADPTEYSEGRVPELALRQFFIKARVSPELRKAMADANFTTVLSVAAVSDTLADFKVQIATILGAAALGATDPEKATSLTFLAALWRKCNTLTSTRDSQRSRLEEDPFRIPEMGISDYNRTSFKKAHPDVILTDFKEPHKRFLERIARDYIVNECILPYELAEVRLRSETIVSKAGMATTPEMLLRISQVDEPARVRLEEDALNRIYAFWVAMEFTGHCNMSWFAKRDLVAGALTSRAGRWTSSRSSRSGCASSPGPGSS